MTFNTFGDNSILQNLFKPSDHVLTSLSRSRAISRNLITGVPEPCSDSAIPNYDCHAGVLGSNPGGPKYFPLGITSMVAAVAPESASGSGSGLYTVVVDARLSGNKRGKSVVTVAFLKASLLG